jgi:hypothetical protein
MGGNYSKLVVLAWMRWERNEKTNELGQLYDCAVA